MGLSETGTIGDKPSSLGVPHLQTDPTWGVSHQGHPVIIQLNSWYLCMEFEGEKGCPKNFGTHSNSKSSLPKMGLSENIGCPEIHWSLVNLPGHRYKIGTYSFQTHPCDTKLEKHKLAGSWVSIFSTDWSDKSPKPLAV
jgi:hypothetical protein